MLVQLPEEPMNKKFVDHSWLDKEIGQRQVKPKRSASKRTLSWKHKLGPAAPPWARNGQ